MNQIDRGHIDYKSEVLRKSIHLCSLSIPVIYYFITKEAALGILIPLAVFSLIIDLARYKKNTKLNQYFHALFGFMLREHEKDHNKKNLNGATYVLLSAVIVILIFPKVLVVTAFAVLIVGDIAAALIGRKFGKTK
ncbi:MAG: dolichol kinase, partial [Ignavibacteriaceae bacterium]|nr:dolichol kinase [Ignavibacteriaceae bacterium]